MILQNKDDIKLIKEALTHQIERHERRYCMVDRNNTNDIKEIIAEINKNKELLKRI